LVDRSLQVPRAAAVHWLNDAAEGTVRSRQRETRLHVDFATPMTALAFDIEQKGFPGEIAECDQHAHVHRTKPMSLFR
jgi:hypothetical protein